MKHVFIGFGSNEGKSEETCLRAVEELRRHPKIVVLRVSSLYRTEPVGVTEQAWFVNGVAQCATELEPEELLRVLQGVELKFGRVRGERWGPRTLDLDVLSYGDVELDLPELVVPHPRLHERRFVLMPLVEIAPDWMHPSLKVSARELLDRLSGRVEGQEVHRLGGQ